MHALPADSLLYFAETADGNAPFDGAIVGPVDGASPRAFGAVPGASPAAPRAPAAVGLVDRGQPAEDARGHLRHGLVEGSLEQALRRGFDLAHRHPGGLQVAGPGQRIAGLAAEHGAEAAAQPAEAAGGCGRL